MRRTLLAFLLIILLAACQQAPGPEDAAESYLEALVAKDEAALSTLSCAAWEEQALLELDSFQAVETRLEDLACTASNTSGDQATVDCAGALIATYNEEDQEFSLADRPFSVVREDGEWLVCGYQ